MRPLELRASHPWLILGMHTNGTGEKVRTLFGSPDDPHDATGRFDFVLATATRVSAKFKLAKPERRSVGETELHYLWIQLFHSALNEKGGAGFEVAKSTRLSHSRLMKITEDVRKYAAERGIAEEAALKNGMVEKSRAFTEEGAELYAKA